LLEKPQWMWMRVAMGLSYNEPDKEGFAIKIYDKLSRFKYLHATPTLMNSGTKFHQLISCFIGVVEDDLVNIMDKAKESSLYVKYTGGVAMSMTKLRALGSPIRSINTNSCGPIPFIKIFDTTINSVVVGGKRAANIVVYMEPRHRNIYDFLDLKETNGDDAVRARKINTALWIPDLFMKQVERNGDWYLFDPAQAKGLDESWGDEFETLYQQYIDKAEKGEMGNFEKVRAQELYKDILVRAAKTGNYWINFKDAHNRANQAKPYAMIHSTNMCTEISIANRSDSTATCTLASLNLSKFVLKQHSHVDLSHMSFEQKMELVDWNDLEETVKIAIQALDNVIDINYFPTPESKKNSFDLRPLGLGVMGFGEMLIDLAIAYDSDEAVRISDMLGAFIYKHALDTSQELAKTRGTFGDYHEGYGYEPRRNILLLSIAPTASISNIAGTSSCIEPYYANVYSRETTSGKFTIIVKQLVEELKAKNLWNEEIKNSIIMHSGSVKGIEELDGAVDKSVYKTVYESDPLAQVDIAAAWQKHIDQAISRNIYAQEGRRDRLGDVYMYARKQGLKGTYYCFIEKTIKGEKYMQDVNKRGERKGFNATTNPNAMQQEMSAQAAKRGFGALADKEPVAFKGSDDVVYDGLTKAQIEEKLIAEKGQEYVDKLKAGEIYASGQCPINPFEKVMCEGCQ
ncbi:MAG: ribonucleoside-diphosphate reductase subunit alpha, partial [Candidatus Absconditabacterales bacterium]